MTKTQEKRETKRLGITLEVDLIERLNKVWAETWKEHGASHPYDLIREAVEAYLKVEEEKLEL